MDFVKLRNDLYFSIGFFMLSLVTIIYMPIATVLLCVICAIYQPSYFKEFTYLYMGFFLSLALSIVYSGKLLINSNATDFTIYYQYYKTIAWDDDWNIYKFEPAYYLFNKFLSSFNLKEIEFSIIMNFVGIYGNFLALKHLNKGNQSKNLLFILIMSCFLFKIGSLSLLWRQSIASIFIILALYSKKRKETYFYLLIGILFHYSTLLVFFVCYFFEKVKTKNQMIFVLMILFLFAMIWFFLLPNIIQHLPLFIRNGFRFALEYRTGLLYYLDAIKTVVYALPIVMACFLLKIRDERYNKLVFFVGVVLLLSPIPHSFRILFPLSVVIIAYYGSSLLDKLKGLSVILYVVLIFFGMYRFISPDLRVQYELFSTVPFYYLNVEAK